MWFTPVMWTRENQLPWSAKKIGGLIKKKFFRYRFNPNQIKVSVIRDYNKAFEVFLKGDLDMFGLSKAEFWYGKLPHEHPLVAKGIPDQGYIL